jgi:hypothetical protein
MLISLQRCMAEVNRQQGNELFGSIKGEEFLYKLREYDFVKDRAPRN